jgi:cell division protein FtsB
MDKDNKNLELDNTDKKLHISDVSDSDLINQIKKYKNELLIDLEEMVYTSEQPIPDSFFNLSRLIDKL